MGRQHTGRALAGLLSLAGCAPGPVDATSFGGTAPVVTTEGSTSTGGSSGSTTGMTPGSTDTSGTTLGSSGSGTGMVWDLGGAPDLGDPKPPGCRGKVDFLFAISRMYNMETAQEQLIASFEPFIASIEGLGDQFEEFDFHIMVVDGDIGWGMDYCEENCGQDDFCDIMSSYPCAYEPSVCDGALGAGTIFNAGGATPNKNCGLAPAKRYLDATTWALEETFTCIAQVGASGAGDLGNALAQAVTTRRDACNKGFLRDDALLVVVHIMRGDVGSGADGTPEEWAKALLDAKISSPAVATRSDTDRLRDALRAGCPDIQGSLRLSVRIDEHHPRVLRVDSMPLDIDARPEHRCIRDHLTAVQVELRSTATQLFVVKL